MGWMEWLGMAFGVLIFLLTSPFHNKWTEPKRATNDLEGKADCLRDAATRSKNTVKPARSS
jgi:hypothetical protein